jgi:hypothetical protein
VAGRLLEGISNLAYQPQAVTEFQSLQFDLLLRGHSINMSKELVPKAIIIANDKGVRDSIPESRLAVQRV